MLQLSPKGILYYQVSSKTKKLVSVSATSTLVTGTRKETVETVKAVEMTKAVDIAGTGKDSGKSEDEYQKNLARILCIRYSSNFEKKFVSVPFDLSSEVNAVYLAFAKELGLSIRPTDIEVQKIDGSTLDTYGRVVAAFSVKDKANQVKFFEKTFLVANVSPEIVLGMLFLILSGADVDFLGRELRWRTYTIEKAFSTTRCIKLVGKKEFAVAALDLEHETYVVHIGSVSFDVSSSSSPLELDVHSSRKLQVSGLIAEEAPTMVLAKYSDFADVFSPDLLSELPKHIRINDHAIEPVESCQQPSYRPIYSLKPVKLENLKAYIETNPANSFIKPSKSPASTLILLD